MNWHPTDDDLILRLYDESTPAEARRIDSHVEACGACRETWRELVDTLKLVDAADTPEPGPAFERLVWARVQHALPAPATSRWSPRQWAPALGLAATVLGAIAIGYQWKASDREAPNATDAGASAAAARERVLLTALDGHFEQAELLLVEVMNAPDAGADQLAFRRATADDLVASGRLYRATAQDEGAVEFALMLDDLESVLVDLARSVDAGDQHDIESLRTRIDDEDLLFKVRAVTSDLRGRTRQRADGE